VFANVVDDAAAATAYTAGVLRRGGLTIAVSTEGEAPALSGLVREGLEAVLPEEVGSWKDEARRLRDEQRSAGVPMEKRRPLLLEALIRLYASRERRSA
jgi:siroheme synthase-like protein